LFGLFTGLRRTEIENPEWSRIDDAIHLPTNKSGREFWLPLIEQHHRILDPIRGLDDRWVFPATSGSGHIVAWDHDHVPGRAAPSCRLIASSMAHDRIWRA
jgi:integrase